MASGAASTSRDSTGDTDRRSGLSGAGRLRRDLARAARLCHDLGPAALVRMARHQLGRAVAWRFNRPAIGAFGERPPRSGFLGMTTPEEQSWLYRYAKRDYRGEGEIVDLGCWLGAASIAIAQGLSDLPDDDERRLRARVHAYDQFLWEGWMEGSVAGTSLAGRLREGESFLPLFAEQTADWRETIVPHPGDLHTQGWGERRPIEILFNDASKSWGLANAIWRDFYPALVPGRSLVVEQDFAHFFTPWVHVLHYRAREVFEPVEAIPYSGSMVFRLARELPAELATGALDFVDFTADEVEAAFERSLALVHPPMRPNVWAARIMWELHQKKIDAARRLWEEGRRRGLRGLDLDRVRQLLAT